jgi:ankyrin repeat protein
MNRFKLFTILCIGTCMLSAMSERDALGIELILAMNPHSSQSKVEELLAAGAHVNMQHPSSNNTTALHQAAFWGQVEFVELLLKNNANKDLPDSMGELPIDKARQMLQKDSPNIKSKWPRYQRIIELLASVK